MHGTGQQLFSVLIVTIRKLNIATVVKRGIKAWFFVQNFGAESESAVVVAHLGVQAGQPGHSDFRFGIVWIYAVKPPAAFLKLSGTDKRFGQGERPVVILRVIFDHGAS